MTPPVLLLGIVIAAGIFAGFLWSVAQGWLASGAAQGTHAAVAALTLAGFAAISLALPGAGRAAGCSLLVAGLLAAWLERGWSRLLPLLPAGFGAALASGLPFAGG